MSEELKCKDKVKPAFKSRLKDIKKLYKLYQKDCEAYDSDLGNLNEYGLSFEFVDNSEDGKTSYFRYAISYGGPSEEFRIYMDVAYQIYKIEFWYLDWFDGAKVTFRKGKVFNWLKEFFCETFCLHASDRDQIQYYINKDRIVSNIKYGVY